MTIQEIQPHRVHAHELYGDYWFNSEPVPITALKGQVILLHFWDYTCNHCLRTLPYIKEWSRKYRELGLVVVGVHSPKFPFGKKPEYVQAAIARYEITYPVVTDNGNIITTNYGNRFWPAVYLIDKDGFVRSQSVGEGSYTATERMIQTLLFEAGVREDLPVLMEPVRDADRPGAVCYRATPDLFTGYAMGSIGNPEGYSPESVVKYVDPRIYLDGRFYAEGEWMNDRECLRYDPVGNAEGHVILGYQALEVNAVVKPGERSGFEVNVKQDDRFLTEETCGTDVKRDASGRSYFVVDEPKMYNLVRNKEYGSHVLRLSTRSSGFALYSFTFVSCVIPELISNN